MVALSRPVILSSLSLLLLLSGCSETEPAPGSSTSESDAASDAASDTSAGSADTETADTSSGSADTEVADTEVGPLCTSIAAGAWNVNGTCIGMLMTGDLTVDASGCGFTLGGWNMNMDVPAGGTIDGETVSFTGRNWLTCTGTVAANGRRVDASCPAAGNSPACTFAMVAQ